MKTFASIDVEQNTITLDGEQEHNQIILDFVLLGEKDKRYDLRKVSFGYQLMSGDQMISEKSWPFPRMRFSGHQPGGLTADKVELTIDTDYKLLVWYAKENIRDTDTILFNTGKPPKAFDSMIWNEELEEWEFIKPYPYEKEHRQIWNEEKLDWEDFILPDIPEDLEEETNED